MTTPPPDNRPENSLEEFILLKNRFNTLTKELYDIHEQWNKLHEEPHDRTNTEHQQRHNQLFTREMDTLQELREVISSINEVVKRL